MVASGSSWRFPNNRSSALSVNSQAYHKLESLVQHVRRVHGRKSAFSCRECGEIFATRRGLIPHTDNCRGVAVQERSHRCRECPMRFVTGSSLKPHHDLALCGSRDGGDDGGDSVQGRVNPSLSCHFCGSAWSTKQSLSQHIRNKHMSDSQRERGALLEQSSRVVWTEKRRAVFLREADRLGWDAHQGIADAVGLSVRQVRNFKLKFPRER